MKLSENQAKLLFMAMALAAEAATEDERFHETWRTDRFLESVGDWLKKFNAEAEKENQGK